MHIKRCMRFQNHLNYDTGFGSPLIQGQRIYFYNCFQSATLSMNLNIDNTFNEGFGNGNI